MFQNQDGLLSDYAASGINAVWLQQKLFENVYFSRPMKMHF